MTLILLLMGLLTHDENIRFIMFLNNATLFLDFKQNATTCVLDNY